MSLLENNYSLRVSVIEQCQYHCPYCLPGSQKDFASQSEWLSLAEYEVLAQVFGGFGVRKVRFTGGEPLLRPELGGIIRAFNSHLNAEMGLTTNGQLLPDWMDELAKANIRHLNVHIDTLKPDRYLKLMGKGRPVDVLASIETARHIFASVKINTVVQKGQNDDELLDLLKVADNLGVELRFIEQMNTGSAQGYVKKTFLAGQDIVGLIAQERPVNKLSRRHQSDPAALFELADTGQKFGVIASDTMPFCADCDRLRLTADGRLKGCLYEPGGLNLKALLRNGCQFDQLNQLVNKKINQKTSFHPTINIGRQPFSMAEVGG